MGIKRDSLGMNSTRPQKQTKLNFSRQMTFNTISTANQSIKGTKSFGASSGKHKKPMTSAQDLITSEPPPRAEHGFTVIEKVGDIFDAPENTVIIHACNCVGSWGAGIAAAFRLRYPKAFEIYKDHCKSTTPDQLIRTALLISPEDSKQRHWVGCLFTSKRYGRGKDTAQEILDATAPSMEELIQQMSQAGHHIKEVRICQINSGLFAVPWDHSKAVIESLELDERLSIPREINVYSLPSTLGR